MVAMVRGTGDTDKDSASESRIKTTREHSCLGISCRDSTLAVVSLMVAEIEEVLVPHVTSGDSPACSNAHLYFVWCVNNGKHVEGHLEKERMFVLCNYSFS